MLYLIGLGLNDEKDLTLRGMEILKNCDSVYAELYTNITNADLKNLGKDIGKEITLLDRPGVEEKAEENMLKDAQKGNSALLVSGDPMVATTHIDLIQRAKKKNIKYKIIHNTSIYSAVAETGLQIYKFGRTASLAYPEGNYFPTSPYDLLKDNLSMGMHTLILLDIRAHENRYMTIKEAINLLLQMEDKKKQNIFTPDTLCIGVARIGTDNQTIKAGKAKDLMEIDFGKSPHSLIVPGKMHYMEEEAIQGYQ